MKKLIVYALVLAAVVSAYWPLAAAQERGFRVIVNRDNPADSITKSELSNYLLKKRSRWDNGVTADPVDLDSSSDVRDAFSRDVHGRSVSSIKKYWQQQIFSGREVPPPELANDAAVVAFVSSRPGAIGYVSPRARLDGVKEVAVSDG